MYKATPRATLTDLHKKLGPEFVKQSEEIQKLEQEIVKHIMEDFFEDLKNRTRPNFFRKVTDTSRHRSNRHEYRFIKSF